MQRKTFAAVLLLAVLALLPPGKAVAGPPEGVSGKMVLAPDEVADGLRKYHKEKDHAKQVELLGRLAKTRDPRVAVELGKWLVGANRDLQFEAIGQLALHFARETRFDNGKVINVTAWWDANEAGLRRRAKQLPQ
jgi:hypothetical protein